MSVPLISELMVASLRKERAMAKFASTMMHRHRITLMMIGRIFEDCTSHLNLMFYRYYIDREVKNVDKPV
jgi:hypothetical protein